MSTFLSLVLTVIRSLFVGFVLAWMTVSMPLTEFYVLVNSPYEELMAKDIFYGYETARTFATVLPILSGINFVIGLVVGACWDWQSKTRD